METNDDFRRAVKDRPYFYLSLLFFALGTGSLGKDAELEVWQGIGLCISVGLIIGLAIFFWGRPIKN